MILIQIFKYYQKQLKEDITPCIVLYNFINLHVFQVVSFFTPSFTIDIIKINFRISKLIGTYRENNDQNPGEI